MAPLKVQPSLACTARISSRPMRPAEPVTAIFMLLMRQPPPRRRRYSNLADARKAGCELPSEASAPGEGDLFQPCAADLGKGAGNGPAAAAPVEVARGRVVEQRPHDQAAQLAHVQRMAAALEQVLAEAHA